MRFLMSSFARFRSSEAIMTTVVVPSPTLKLLETAVLKIRVGIECRPPCPVAVQAQQGSFLLGAERLANLIWLPHRLLL